MNVIYSKKEMSDNVLRIYAELDGGYAYAQLKSKNGGIIVRPGTKLLDEQNVFMDLFNDYGYTIAIKTHVDLNATDYNPSDLINLTDKTEGTWNKILKNIKENTHYSMLDNFDINKNEVF
jgi:hypothetical protein